MLSYVFRYKFSILLAILIALLSLVPSSSMPDSSLFSISYIDKIAHFCMYGSFTLVALLESRCHLKCIASHLLLLLGIFLLSALIEVLQATVIASRAAEWLDLAANLSGIISGYVAYRILVRMRLFPFLKS